MVQERSVLICFLKPVVAVLAVLLAACTGGNSLTTTNLADQEATGSSTSAFADTSKDTSSDQPFNPLSDRTETSYSQREVISSPTIADVMKTGPLPERALGRANARVTVIKYASLTCPHCRKFQRDVFPRLKQQYIDTGKVRFIIREFPIGRSAGNATIALRCAPESKYFTLYGKFLAHQPKWVSQQVRLDAIHKVAAQVGLSRAKFDACLKNQELIDGLKWVKQRGRKLGVIGTPNFFVQNKLIKTVLTYSELRKLIDPLLATPRAATAANSRSE